MKNNTTVSYLRSKLLNITEETQIKALFKISNCFRKIIEVLYSCDQPKANMESKAWMKIKQLVNLSAAEAKY